MSETSDAASSGFATKAIARSYSSHSRLTSTKHSIVIEIYESFLFQLVRSGREKTWTTIGHVTFRAQGHPGGDVGEGDYTGGPYPERGMNDSWPTLVIQAGHSKPLIELRNDMRWWFSTSEHQVKIVLLATFEHARRALILEKWEEEPGMTRPGATTTRHAAAPQPVLRQTITITEDITTNPVSYNVAGGALVLGFRLLFLRDPGPGEGDCVLSVQELQVYADEVHSHPLRCRGCPPRHLSRPGPLRGRHHAPPRRRGSWLDFSGLQPPFVRDRALQPHPSSPTVRPGGDERAERTCDLACAGYEHGTWARHSPFTTRCHTMQLEDRVDLGSDIEASN